MTENNKNEKKCVKICKSCICFKKIDVTLRQLLIYVNMSTEQNTENGRSVNAVELDFAKYMRAYTENAHLDVKQYTWQTLEFFMPTICRASLDIADHGFIVDVMRMYSAYIQHNTDDEKTQQRVKRHAEKLLQACEECNAVHYQVNAFQQWFDLMCNNDYENSNEQQ